ncbi:ComF family protein [Thalassotalea marina]|nr:ComF family protein [Thalassotalea marina]
MELFSRVHLVLYQKLKHLFQHSLTKVSCCSLCHQKVHSSLMLCRHCLSDLPTLHYPDNFFNLLHWPAIDLLFKKRNFDQLICVAPYVWPFDHWLKQLKYQHKFQLSLGLAEIIALQLKSYFQQNKYQKSALTCVPTDVSRWQQRGFNPAHLIAQHLAKMSQIHYQPNLLRRINTSDSQVGKTGAQRRKDLKNAFEVTDVDCSAKHIVLFDDVITTGSTVNEISRLLKKQGVQHVTVLTLAIALPK